jgi:anaerobic ribonucleoside-triphosphate reductase
MRSRQAIGPGGVAVNRTYAEYTETAHRLLRALFDAYLAGDARGRPFLSPRPILHITKHFNEQPGYRGLLDLASRVAAERGLTFVFDRDDSASFFNRYGLVDDRAVETSASSEWRSAALQVVALNLPRVAFLAAGDQVRVFEELTRLMEAAAQAHLEKRVFLEKLLAQGEQGPLSVIALRVGSKPFLRLSWMTHWISPIGLAEMTRAVLGVESYEDDGAREFAARVVSHLRREAERLSNKHKVRFVLAETASYSVAHRLAGLDVRFFGKAAVDVMRGSPDTGAGYYTTGAKVPAGADVSPLERVRVEGTFHQHGILDAASDLWLGGKVPTPEQIAIAVSQAFYQSTTSSLVIAPTFTTCLDCGAISHGLSADCATCGSTRVDGLVGGAGSSTNTSSWDAGRQAELADRRLLGE